MKKVTTTNGSFLENILQRASKQISAVRIVVDKELVPLSTSQETFLLLFFAYFLTSHKERAIELIKETRPDLEFVVDSISERCFSHWFFDIVQNYAKDYERTLNHLETLSPRKREALEDNLRAREAILLVDLQKLMKSPNLGGMNGSTRKTIREHQRSSSN